MAIRRALTRGHKAFQVEGLDQLQRNVERILNRTRAENLKEVFMHGAKVVRDEMKDLAPVKTGVLRAAIFAAPGDPRKPDALAGVSMKSAAKGGAPHAMLVEYGTSRSRPHRGAGRYCGCTANHRPTRSRYRAWRRH